MFRNDASDFHAAARDGCCAEERACFNAVRDGDACTRAERFDALDGEGTRATTLNLCAHAREEVDEVVNFRFEGGILQDAYALGKCCSHQDVDRCTDARNREVEVTTREAAFACGFDVTVRDGNLCTERFETLEVKVHRARAPGASAGERDAATSESGDERAEHVEACAHGLHEFVRRFEMVHAASIDF